MALISILVPTRNKAQNIQILYDRLRPVFENMPEHEFELIFSDDSANSMPQMIAQLRQKDERVKVTLDRL
jgi:glycosyltransferase involved in cell wall biosynthesis